MTTTTTTASSPAEAVRDVATTETVVRLVSMNIVMAEPSHVAPDSWTEKDQEEHLLAELLASDPHVLALQECPSPLWVETVIAKPHKYHLVGCEPTHMGYACLLIKNADITRLPLEDIPGVAARVMVPGAAAADVVFVSVHLEPFREGDTRRFAQLREILNSVAKTSVVIAGDTNMREKEKRSVKRLGLRDAWIETGSDNATRWTWDTKDHRESGGGGSFNEYYGSDTRQYQARYDRVLLRADDHLVRVKDFGLLAHKPIPPSDNHFLSDHFGISVQLEVT